ncbi:uncharacterized protein LOC100115209 isoform X1 [Nasonia vitripennis]|uniref:Uncharacterized protein n=1 Tax=Nasonia vitripennis TaxID=7425 RepID=A0A7M7PUH4_NASVI|nr:uncharacterized protein LOC100115209 isoform X1 [Nasonia vitripennis]
MLYEQSIYKIILPICKDIEDKVNEMESNLQGKSHAALDVSKWKIQSTLRDVKLEMQKLTKGFKVQGDQSRCIEKLEEGMSIMINMYDRIEYYHDKAELADYIANINSNRANGIRISNEVLRRDVDDLKWIIQSDLVLEKYETSIKAFMQHIYPFADYFIAEFDLPTSLKSDDTKSLVAISSRKISILKSKLIASEITINKYDEFIRSRVSFNSKGNRSSPFFVWKNNEHKNAIRKLLEEEEITVKSDIRRGLNNNAIKFDTIGIYFKLANQAIQNELNEHLEDFVLWGESIPLLL